MATMAGSIFVHNLMEDASNLYFRWKHLGRNECFDQVEAHLESQGYRRREIEYATDQLFSSVPFDGTFKDWLKFWRS